MMQARCRNVRIPAWLLVGLVVPQAMAAQAGSGTMALVGGMLLDGYETPPIHHAAVVIEDNRIVAVGRASEVEIPAGAEIINTEGMTMLPGLVDLHVHLMILGHGEYAEWWPILDGAREEMMAISARQLLMAGVTTAVDLGAPLEILNVRDDINEGRRPGPRMLVSGPWVTRVGQQFPPWFQRRITSPEEAAEQTDDLIDAGVDLIKIWAGMSEEDMRAVVETAHRRGVEVHTHLYAPEDMWAAIRAGTDVIQHAGSGGNPPYSDDLIAEIAHRGIPIVQTIAHRIWVYPATWSSRSGCRTPASRRICRPTCTGSSSARSRTFTGTRTSAPRPARSATPRSPPASSLKAAPSSPWVPIRGLP